MYRHRRWEASVDFAREDDALADRAGRRRGILDAMLIVHVHVQVKPGSADAFIEATRLNARASLGEPGVLRFDVVREIADPGRFVLVEVYRDDAAPAAHKETAHYKAWREAVEPMMAAPRSSTKLAPIEPASESGWRSA